MPSLFQSFGLVRLGIRALVYVHVESQLISAAPLPPRTSPSAFATPAKAPDIYQALEIAQRSGAGTVALVNHTA